MSGESEEKTDQASNKKLDKLRERGIIATAPTASEYIGLSAGLVMVFALWSFMLRQLSDAFDRAFAFLGGKGAPDYSQQISYYLVDLQFPFLAILGASAAAAVLFKIISQNGFVFSMEQVQLNFDAVNPVNGIKKIFKVQSLVTFLATFVRFSILMLVLFALGSAWAPHLLNLDLCVPGCAWPTMWAIIFMILIACAVLIVVSIFFDIAVQRAFFLQEQMMTKTETKQERKEQYGTPEVRGERKRLARELLDGADVVGTKRASIYFFWEDDAVAFAFHPVKIPLPKLAARARGHEASMILRSDLEAQNIPGFRHQKIVEASLDTGLGENAKREIFLPLAAHLRTIYS